jgi:glycosyltransferase involved in cell wall biosynthesis
MRVLIACTHWEVVGGVETYLRALLPLLADRGHEVAVLHERAASREREAIDGLAREAPAWCVERAGREAVDAAARWRPDVAYVQGLESPDVEEDVAGRLPSVLFAHNYHGACVSGTKRHAFPVARPCGRGFGPGCLLHYYPRRCGGLDPRTLFRLYGLQARRRALLRRYRAVAVASRHMAEEYRRLGLPAERLRVLPLFAPGAEPDAGPPAAMAHPPDPPGRVLMMGRLTDLKGGRMLVEAMRRAQGRLGRPLRLTVAGDGPERGAMEAAARRAGVRAEFTGWVGPERRTPLMRDADLLAVPSVWPEPFGLVGIEAGCVGLPAAAFNVGGVRDWLRPGESGELAPGDPPTANGLAAAMVRALADAGRLARLRVGAWEVARGFGAGRHLDGLERILAEARAPGSAEYSPC